MPFVNAGGEAVITVPAGKKLTLGSFGDGYAEIYKEVPPTEQTNMFAFLQTLRDTQTTLDVLDYDIRYRLCASNGCNLEYVIGCPPYLSHTPQNVTVDFSGLSYKDHCSTPGDFTCTSSRGRAAFAEGGTTVTGTHSLVKSTSTILVSLIDKDATLTMITVTCADGSFTVTGNAAATAITSFNFFVVN